MKKVYFLLLLIHLFDGSRCTRECEKNETRMTLTECDPNGSRWKFKVPKIVGCQVSVAQVGETAPACGFRCQPGEFWDLEDGNCKSCPPGSFSIGSGIRFDEWNHLPTGFSYSVETITLSDFGYETKVTNCSESTWKPVGSYIQSNSDDCASRLMYSALLQIDGSISFTYRHTDNDLLFHFYIEDDQCRRLQTDNSYVFLNTTGAHWNEWKVALSKGSYRFFWSVNGLLLENSKKLSPVKISVIQIDGVESDLHQRCRPCKGGFFNPDEKQSSCLTCPADTWSSAGSNYCKRCDKDTHYSLRGSEICIERPPCTKHDFLVLHSICDVNNLMNASYEWIQPIRCLLLHPKSVKLPLPSINIRCLPCNPGFQQESDSRCRRCPENSFSNGTNACQKCPANTEPNIGYWIQSWNRLPDIFTTSCFTTNCFNKTWLPTTDHIHTIFSGTAEDLLILTLQLKKGFYGLEEGKDIFGTISFQFETECEEDCQLFITQNFDGMERVINSWTGPQPKQAYVYDVTTNAMEGAFSWIFQKSHPLDVARIYYVKATNVIGGVADSCHSCRNHGDVFDHHCLPCPPGHFNDPQTASCVSCPDNTYLHGNQCERCGPGTTSNPQHTRCVTNCTYRSPATQQVFDFRGLGSNLVATVTNKVTRDHKNELKFIFNISLCGDQPTSQCFNNMTTIRDDDVISGMVCRSLLIQTGQDVMTSQPTLLADQLVGIYHHDNQHLPTNPFSKANISDDDVIIHLRYNNTNLLRWCSSGRSVFLHLRCDPNNKIGSLLSPQQCVYSTCDGCTYHLLWEGREACPLCSDADYDVVTSSCLSGVRRKRFLWKQYPSRCYGGVKLPEDQLEGCVDVVRLIVIISVICVPIFILIACFFYKRTKKLEYKYQKLMMKSGQLAPSAGSCAIQDSDSEQSEDEDKVIFQRSRNKNKSSSNQNLITDDV